MLGGEQADSGFVECVAVLSETSQMIIIILAAAHRLCKVEDVKKKHLCY